MSVNQYVAATGTVVGYNVCLESEMIIDYIGLYIIAACIIASLSAQVVKVILTFFKSRKVVWQKLFHTGGMPSSHSAFVACLASLTGAIAGVDSIYFAIATCFAIVVMHDAMSVRHSVGVQAQRINELNQIFKELSKELSPDMSIEEYQDKLSRIKELLGHSPIEVAVGGLYGAAVGGVAYWISLRAINL